MASVVVLSISLLLLLHYPAETAGDNKCTAQHNIVVDQKELFFDHPATAVTVSFQCPSCSATNVMLSCISPAWLQTVVQPPSALNVLGNGSCLLSPDAAIPPASLFTFLYEYSPLDLQPTQADFFGCN